MVASKKPLKYEQVTEGEWFRPTKKHYEQCCGCGMRHATEYRIKEGELWIKTRVIRGPVRKAARGTR